jgi:hypothetical protein
MDLNKLKKTARIFEILILVLFIADVISDFSNYEKEIDKIFPFLMVPTIGMVVLLHFLISKKSKSDSN